MESHWYKFIGEYKDQIPYKPLSVILEAFYWYVQMSETIDNAYRKSSGDKVFDLMIG